MILLLLILTLWYAACLFVAAVVEGLLAVAAAVDWALRWLARRVDGR